MKKILGWAFSHIDFETLLKYQNDEKVLVKDICTLLSQGIYKPSYAELVHPYLSHEIDNFMNYFKGDIPFNLTVDYLGSLCDTGMKPCNAEIDRFLKKHHINDKAEQERFKSNLLNECFGCGFICSYMGKADKQERIYLYDMVENPFYTLHTFAHELTHAMQDKNHYQTYEFVDEKHLRDYKEIHANLTADAFLMIKALQTKNANIVKETQKKLLSISSQMSNVMKTPDLGIRYFEWKGLKNIISHLPRHYRNILTSDGQINWNSLYDYTTRKVEEMDYNPLKVKKAKKFLAEKVSPLWKRDTTNKEFFEEIKKLPKTNDIFNDFLDGFRYFIQHPKTDLQKIEQFYQKLANPTTRKERLFASYNNSIPYIEEYRKYGKGKLLHESVAVEIDDKSVFIEPKKGRLRRLTDRFLGKNTGDVTTVKTAPERKKTNTTLRGILKDNSLSGAEKKTKLRETVAKYREESGTNIPNKKVGDALKKYLPQQNKGR